MEVTMPLGDEASDAAFRALYENLYHRLCRLADNVAGAYLYGDAHAFLTVSTPREGVPRFVAATFEKRAADSHEKKVLRELHRRRFARELPMPAFPVLIDVAFADGSVERVYFPFERYGDETVEAFCTAVCDAARIRYRNRFARRG